MTQRRGISRPRVVIIGIGNDFRRDDGAGLAVARKLRDKVARSLEIVEGTGEGTGLMKAWENADRAVIIDAVNSGAPPGTFFRFEAEGETVPATFFACTTHTFSVVEAVELARALGILPAQLTIWGIEGRDFSWGRGLSGDVESKIDEVVSRVLADL